MAKKRPRRDPVRTRRSILEAAYAEVRRHGFRKLNTDRVLAAAGVTKGALYHHFHNKQALGCALIDEWVGPGLEERWIRPIEEADEPLEALARALDRWARETRKDDLAETGAFTRLADELGSESEAFASRLARIHARWLESWTQAFSNAARDGSLRGSADPSRTAEIAVACVQGLEVAGRIAPTKAFWKSGVDALAHWVRGRTVDRERSGAPVRPADRKGRGVRGDASPRSGAQDTVVVYRIGGGSEGPAPGSLDPGRASPPGEVTEV